MRPPETMLSATERLIASLGGLSAEAQLYAAQARHLAALLDTGDAPGYSLANLHREVRCAIGALLGAPLADAGLSDDDLHELLDVRRR